MSSTFTTGTTRCNNFAGEIENLKTAAQTILRNCGMNWSPNRINRLCVRYHRNRIDGFGFFDYIANTIHLDAERRVRALSDPEVARVLTYVDPTGENAVRNVMKDRGF